MTFADGTDAHGRRSSSIDDEGTFNFSYPGGRRREPTRGRRRHRRRPDGGRPMARGQRRTGEAAADAVGRRGDEPVDDAGRAGGRRAGAHSPYRGRPAAPISSR